MSEEVADRRLGLRADCSRCAGLCCVALTFSASADFAIDKPAGEPCPNLGSDHRCGIHGELRQRGFKGCTVYDCLGAGQRVVEQHPQRMFQVFPIMRDLHELLWYLTEALTLETPLRDELQDALDETERLTRDLPDLDMAAYRKDIGALLSRVSELVRVPGKNHRGADLIGASLRGADLRGADLRGAYLIEADLRDADLSLADLLGADLRNTDLGGADLRSSIFLTQAQLDAAKGDAGTRVPPSLSRSAYW